MRFYTSVTQWGDNILLRGYEDGHRVHAKVPYKPYVFLPCTPDEATHHSVYGIPVKKHQLKGIKDARRFVDQFSQTSGMTIYGMTNWPYLFIHDEFPGDVEYDPDMIRTVYLDIEVDSPDGFPEPLKAEFPITAITLRFLGETVVFSFLDYDEENEASIAKVGKIVYEKASDEEHLLRRFLAVWQEMDFDVVSGWHIEKFDIPYIINRIVRLFSKTAAEKLSPWSIVRERQVGEDFVYDIAGIAQLDYLPIYKKFSFKNQESYTLKHILHVEGLAPKHAFEQRSLSLLMSEDPQAYIDYNVWDAGGVEALEAKKGFIAMMFAFAYDAKVLFTDTMATVRPWDCIIHNYLMDVKKQVVEPEKDTAFGDKALVGGYVKEPNPVGLSEWVVGLDVRSEYPHAIMQWNISPETLKCRLAMPPIDKLVADPSLIRNSFDDEPDEIFSANGCRYDRTKTGFLAELMDKMFLDRKAYQKKFKEATDTKIKERYHNLQLAKKIQLNAGYGALANMYFRWFNFDLAESVTTCGQLTIKWVQRVVNEIMNRYCGTKDADYVIAIDTDSCYIRFETLVRKSGLTDKTRIITAIDTFCNKVLEPGIAKGLEGLAERVNAVRNRMVMNREIIADKAIWTAPKHYILNVVWSEGKWLLEKPEQKMKGIEAVKSSTPMVCRDKIKSGLTIALNGTEEELRVHVQKFYDEFIALPFQDIASPISLGNMWKYSDAADIFKKGAPAQVKAALMHNHLLKKHNVGPEYPPLHDGDKIKWCYLKDPNPLGCNTIAATSDLPAAFGLDKYVDRDLQFEKKFYDPLMDVVRFMGWTIKPEKVSAFDSFYV